MHRWSAVVALAVFVVSTSACSPPAATSAPPSVVAVDSAAGSHPDASLSPAPPTASASAASNQPSTPAPVQFGSVEVTGDIKPMTVRLVGDRDVLTGWRSATRRELEDRAADVPASGILLVPNGKGTLLLAWGGGACDRGAVLSVAPSSLVLTEDPRPACDAVWITKGVALTPAIALDPAHVTLTLVPAIPTR